MHRRCNESVKFFPAITHRPLIVPANCAFGNQFRLPRGSIRLVCQNPHIRVFRRTEVEWMVYITSLTYLTGKE